LAAQRKVSKTVEISLQAFVFVLLRRRGLPTGGGNPRFRFGASVGCVLSRPVAIHQRRHD
jgi:hypothetical protein